MKDDANARPDRSRGQTIESEGDIMMVTATTTAITDQASMVECLPPAQPTPPGGGLADRKLALQEVYDRYVEQIYRFIYFKVGNREDAEDITSQVFMKAANSLDVTQEDSVKLGWLYQVARTTITDHWRGYYKGLVSSLDEMEEASPLHLAAPDLVLADPEHDPSNPAAERVRAILSRLPDNYRRVLELRFLQGCSLKETAEAMGITEGNAKVLQHRALHKAASLASQHP